MLDLSSFALAGHGLAHGLENGLATMLDPALFVHGIGWVTIWKYNGGEGDAESFLQKPLTNPVGICAPVVPCGLESAVFERGIAGVSLAQEFKIACAGDATLRVVPPAGGQVFQEVIDAQRRHRGYAAQLVRRQETLED